MDRLQHENEQLRVQIQRLEQATRAKSRYLSNMSHEIRTPLGLLLGYTDLLLQEINSTTPAKEYAFAVKRNGQFLQQLIDDILDLSKIEAGMLKMNPTQLELPSLMKDIENIFKIQCQDKNIELHIRADQSAPLFFMSDETRLKQILINLIGNSLKFTQTGSIDVSFSSIQEDARNLIQIDIIDTGKGINLEKQRDIFNEYQQEDSSISSKFGGSGLGLTLSKKLSVALGGDLNLISSQVGVGSHFRCVVKDFMNEYESRVENRKSHINEAYNEDTPNLSGLRIVVVDDNADNLNLMNILLKKTKAQVFLYSDTEHAINFIKSNKVELVLLDIQMPQMNGFECLKSIRQKNDNQRVWALTAYAFKNEQDEIMSSGFDDILSKPISTKILYTKLNTLKSIDQQLFI